MFAKLDDENFLIYASHFYDNPQCIDVEEFYEDVHKFKYIKRLLNKYRESGVLKERLILNHLIVIYNVFPSSAATAMLFLKLDGFYKELKPFLQYLNQLPDQVCGINSETNIINTEAIPSDADIKLRLQKINEEV